MSLSHVQMTDVGDISSEEFAEIWAEMAAAEHQATLMEKRLLDIHKNLDDLLESLPNNQEAHDKVTGAASETRPK